jgi:subtilisin-like proprotein convertase family protein
MGHQMGANHTFSFDVEGTGVNVEPGSGSTIMGYAGITNQDIAAHSDDYFVYNSIKQVQDNMVGKTCPVRTPIADQAPAMNAGADYIIPKSTPFILTGSGTDPDGDAISYCWEENDSATTQTGNASQASATKTGGPNWRSYDPVSSPSRFCPPIERVVANSLVTNFGSIKSEAVSSVARELNFVLTGRDNHLGIGQTHSDEMTVTVTNSAGPFLVQSPNTAVSYQAGSNQVVTWAVAGTDANGVDCAFVDIYLSTDGGLTYPNQLASQVPNDGSETVSIPNLPGTTNRIMVRGYQHLFYDISNVNFTIAAPSASFYVSSGYLPGIQNKSVCQGGAVSFTLSEISLASFNGPISFSASGQPAGSTVDFSPSTITGDGAITVSVNNTQGATPGLYPIVVTATSGSATRTVPLYLQLYSSNFDAMQLNSPADNATAVSVSPVLYWSANSNASQYDVQIATDPAFTNVVQSATVSSTSYTAAGLSEATTYYWRVTPKNASCAGSASTAFTFQTGHVACNSYDSENVPVTISANGTDSVTSILDVSDDNAISNISITMNIQHTWVNDLSATLISPTGTAIPIFINPCASDDLEDIQATFADGGAPLSCTGAIPAINGTFAPASPLSALIGESSAGTWTLQVDDAFDQDGGAILGWSLNICSTQALGVKQDQAMNLSLYPNPNNGAFHLQFDNAGGGDVKVSVHDILGRELLVRNFHDAGIFSEDLQLQNAAAGTYLVTVQSGSRKEVRKIIVR